MRKIIIIIIAIILSYMVAAPVLHAQVEQQDFETFVYQTMSANGTYEGNTKVVVQYNAEHNTRFTTLYEIYVSQRNNQVILGTPSVSKVVIDNCNKVVNNQKAIIDSLTKNFTKLQVALVECEELKTVSNEVAPQIDTVVTTITSNEWIATTHEDVFLSKDSIQWLRVEDLSTNIILINLSIKPNGVYYENGNFVLTASFWKWLSRNKNKYNKVRPADTYVSMQGVGHSTYLFILGIASLILLHLSRYERTHPNNFKILLTLILLGMFISIPAASNAQDSVQDDKRIIEHSRYTYIPLDYLDVGDIVRLRGNNLDVYVKYQGKMQWVHVPTAKWSVQYMDYLASSSLGVNCYTISLPLPIRKQVWDRHYASNDDKPKLGLHQMK